MRIAVVGGRDYKDFKKITDVLSNYVKKGDTIISGGARGVDTLAEMWAREHMIKFTKFEPAEHARSEYLKRNDLIVFSCEVLLAFPDPFSKGTFYTIKKAQKNGKRVVVFS